MRLRSILLILAIMAFVFSSAGGYSYYTSLKEAALLEAEGDAEIELARINKNLSYFLSAYSYPTQILAGEQEVKELLAKPGAAALQGANHILGRFRNTLGAEACYIMDRTGTVLASSNHDDPDSFVGENFSFRPYYDMAMMGMTGNYLALGAVTGKRGAYFSHPIYLEGETSPSGVAVIKGSIEMIERETAFPADHTVMVVDPNGIIFLSNRPEWLYHTIWQVPEETIGEVAASRQFGKGPWEWAGLEMAGENQVIDGEGRKYFFLQVEMDKYPAWKLIHLYDMEEITGKAFSPLVFFVRPIVLTFVVVICLSVFMLYRQASLEIRQRKAAEEALRQSDARYRFLYHNTPAMLHSINSNGEIVSVSDYWAEVFGYSKDEVVGRKLSDFLTKESKKYAAEVVFPEFFKKGFCTDIPYQVVKKDGGIMDVLLSAIGERDAKGEIFRTLAVSIDVTERNRAVEALRIAKEKLASYSKDLEKQVAIRTREISNILEYTPDVVYVKDRDGKYRLVNSRFEELFGVRNEEIRGKFDHEIPTGEAADEFRKNDLLVLQEGRSIQVEERLAHNNEVHTYLSVKFPVYDEAGAINGVCSISTDITAVKRAQEQMQRLPGRIMASQEKERTAIARELHDELGQVLTALRMDATWIGDRLEESNPQIFKRTLTMRDLIDKTIDNVRSLAIRLRPGILDDLGLAAAVEWLTSDFEKRYGIICIFEYAGIPKLNETVSTAAYRICQEAMTNVARYANAGKVTVVLKAEEGMLRLSVTDDGEGFDTERLPESQGVGIAGMRERAVLAGGSLEIVSGKNKGCRVLFKVPLQQDEKET